MLEAILTLMLLSSGGSADAVTPSNPNYTLELAFEQAELYGADNLGAAIDMQMAQADERVAEAEAAAAAGDLNAMNAALASYGYTVSSLATDVMAADNVDDEVIMAQLDAALASQGDRIDAVSQQDPTGQEGGEGEAGEEAGGNSCTRTDHPVVLRIAETYGLDYGTVMAQHCGEGAHGFGTIMVAARISQQTGISIDEILARRAAGEGWGKIKRELGVIGQGTTHGNKNGNSRQGEEDGGTGNGNGNSNGNGNGNGNSNGNGNGNNGNGNGSGNSNGNGNGNGNRNGNGDDDGDDDAGEEDGGGDDGSAEPTSEPTEEPTQEPTAEPTTQG